MLDARQPGQCRVAGQVLAWKGVSQVGPGRVSVIVHNHKAKRWSYLPQPDLVANAVQDFALFAVLREDGPGAASCHMKFLVW
jgi:hypothetical protein